MPYELFPFQKYSDHIHPAPDLPPPSASSSSTPSSRRQQQQQQQQDDEEQQLQHQYSKDKHECYYGSSSGWKICPVCVLPLVAVFVIVFAIVQLFIIYRSIENYKLREQEYKDCYFPDHHHHHELNGGGTAVVREARSVELVASETIRTMTTTDDGEVVKEVVTMMSTTNASPSNNFNPSPSSSISSRFLH